MNNQLTYGTRPKEIKIVRIVNAPFLDFIRGIITAELKSPMAPYTRRGTPRTNTISPPMSSPSVPADNAVSNTTNVEKQIIGNKKLHVLSSNLPKRISSSSYFFIRCLIYCTFVGIEILTSLNSYFLYSSLGES